MSRKVSIGWLAAALLAMAAPSVWAQTDAEVMEEVADVEAVEDAAEVEQDADKTDALEEPAEIQATVGWLELSGRLRDAPIPYAWVGDEDAGQSLKGVLGQLRSVASGEQYEGVIIYLDQARLSLTQVDAIVEAMNDVRRSGKKVFTFAEAYDTRDYLLASAADMILLQHKGSVDMTGLAVEEMYLAGLLEKIGVKADMMQVGKYKGAAEALTNTGPSPAWNENFDALMTDLYDQIIGRIADGRGMSRDEVEAIIRDSWTMTDTDYISRRVVDRLVNRDLIGVTEIEFGDGFVWDDTMGLTSENVQAGSPFAMFQMLFQEQSHATHRPTLAIIHANGPIVSGDSTYGDGFFTDDSIGSRTFNRVLGEAADDDNIKGVVVRIDSPGGSALASEVIWQAIRKFGEEKPVFVSIGAMAASGGYYIASAGDEIYVAPQTIVGSIGVVSGKLVLGGLYEKVGINVYRRNRGPLGDMFNSVEPFNDEQRQAVQAGLDKVYDQFTERVTLGRGSRLPDITRVDEGMLFTGRQAVDNGMADKVGTIEHAVADLAEQLGLEPDSYDVINLPRPMSFQEWLSELFATSSPAAAVDPQSRALMLTARRLLGDEAWRSASHVLEGLMLLRDEHVLTLCPRVIVIR